MKKLIISLLILIVLVIAVIFAVNSNNQLNENDDEKIKVIATVYPVYDFAREIAGDKMTVSMFLSPGVEIHDYEPTPQDIIKIENSDLFLFLGKELEPWANTVISGINNKENLKDVSTGIALIEKEEEHTSHEEHEKYDTHIWLDPTKASQIVRNITECLCEIDKENSEYYKDRSNNYIEKLNNLDKNFEQVASNGKRKKIAFGGAFSYAYFIKRYNLEYISAYDSCGEGNEPSIDKVLDVAKGIKEDNLPVIFYKELSSGNIVKTIVEETNAEPLEFNSLHSITKEQLENGETYLTIMNKNLRNLERALN